MKKKRHIWLWVLLGIVALVVLLAVFGHKHGGTYQINSDAVAVEKLTENVSATGVVQPVYKVTVGTQVSGIVKKLHVDYNSRVKQGQLLAELDKSLLQENVNVTRANLAVAKSQENLAQKDFNRVQALYDSKAATRQEYDQAEAQLEQAKNHLITAQANYDNAITQLRYAEIYSPIDGVIISKQVEEGQTVQGAYSVPNLFTIAKNLTEIQVEAKVDEADIGQVHEGQSVSFKVDAYPGEEFLGSVTQIRMEPQTNNNVVTYVVIINAHNPDEKLFPGMTASVAIITSTDSGICIPIYATQLNTDESIFSDLERQGYTIDSTETLHETSALDETPLQYVWVKDGRKLTRRPITIGTKTKVKAIVTNGLVAGDTIVTSIVDYAKQKAERKGNMFD